MLSIKNVITEENVFGGAGVLYKILKCVGINCKYENKKCKTKVNKTQQWNGNIMRCECRRKGRLTMNSYIQYFKMKNI